MQLRRDCCADQGSGLTVYLSATADFKAAGTTRCNASPTTASFTASVALVACPAVSGARYVTVLRPSHGQQVHMSLAEIRVSRQGRGGEGRGGCLQAM